MVKLYLDSNIADWAYVIFKADWGEKIRVKDTKLPIKRKIEQYVCLRYLMDLDDEWDIIFGTSNMMKKENIDDFEKSSNDTDKLDFLSLFYELLVNKTQITHIKDLENNGLFKRLRGIGIEHKDAIHLAEAKIGQWDYFITLDDDILKKRNAIKFTIGLKVRNPSEFIHDFLKYHSIDKEHPMDMGTLIRALHGSWVCKEDVFNSTTEYLESNQVL